MILRKSLKKNHIICKCSFCQNEYDTLKGTYYRQLKKHNRNYCIDCGRKFFPRPQNTKEYWSNQIIKDKHSQAIKKSEKYRCSLKTRDTSGVHNGMFGKKHSVETRRKMSIARIGKIGEKATAWKGGDFSLVRSIKKHISNVIHWYKKVYQRDHFRCVLCGSKKQIDAHHIQPISLLIKKLLNGQDHLSNQEKYIFLISQPEIIDLNLSNGITLCRNCHRHIHLNWGSHFSKVKSLNELKKDYEENPW